ncbi:MAG: flagellar biosynthetic protein FliR [Myxococcales bacterium]|nr:flagellar biosynthetic protein FliR [Myxococcales bacterium]
MDATQIIAQLRADLGIQVDFTQLLMAFALLLARVVPVIILTPFLGGETVPNEVRIGLGVMIGLVLFPAITAQVQNVPVSAFLFVALMLKELFIGLTMSFAVGLVFDAANVAGNLVDTMSGTNMAQVMVPQIQQQVSLFSNLQLQLTTVVFLTLGGHHVIIQTFGESLALVPLDQYPRFSHGQWAFFDTVIRMFGDLLRIAIALASPVLLATFLTDLALGMINRVAPQVQVYFVSMQIKPAVTILIMFTAMHLIIGRMVGEFGSMFVWLKRALQLLS